MSEHPSPSELGILLEGSLASNRGQEVLRHLLVCRTCRAEFCRTLNESLRAGISPEQDAAYDRVLDSALRTARYLDSELNHAKQVTSLLATGGGLAALLEGDISLNGFGVYQALLGRSRTVRHDNPQEMVSLARCAVEVAMRLKSDALSYQQRMGILAQAWGELGNACRAADDLFESSRAFTEAFAIVEREGLRDPLLKARLYDLLSSLHGTRREFMLAFGALDVALKIYKDLGDRHLIGRALIKKGIYKHYSGESEEAIRLTRKGLSSVDESRESDLAVFAIHNILSFLVACNRFPEARKALFQLRPRIQGAGQVNLLKLRWLEGQISYGMKQLKSAEEAFLEVREGFEKLELGYAAALSSLDLGLVWMRQGRTRETKEIVMQAAELFTSLKVRVQALVAVLLLRDAFATDTASVALYESVVEFIRRTDIDPDARFVPPTE